MGPDDVAKHSFYPLLGYEKITRSMEFDDNFPLLVKKPRAIRYASHKDSAIYSVYARSLGPTYDNKLSQLGLNHSVLAYRSGIGNNITFAKSLFDDIDGRSECSVICLDISKFFDNLDHAILKSRLCSVIECNRLPADLYKIFRRLTRFEYVMRPDIEARIGKLKGGRICNIDVFDRDIRPIIIRNNKECGIPQGTLLSGLLANIYLLHFDGVMNYFVKSLGGSYRRYSDDIAIVIPKLQDCADVMSSVRQCLMYHCLSLNDDKTAITHFSRTNGILGFTGDDCQYLGFLYDGRKILIRPASMKNFYAKMKRGVRAYIKGAHKKGVSANQIRKRVPIGRFTHWGDSKNFVQYAYRASIVMGAPEIKRQLRNHVTIFNRHWDATLAKVYGGKEASPPPNNF